VLLKLLRTEQKVGLENMCHRSITGVLFRGLWDIHSHHIPAPCPLTRTHPHVHPVRSRHLFRDRIVSEKKEKKRIMSRSGLKYNFACGALICWMVVVVRWVGIVIVVALLCAGQ